MLINRDNPLGLTCSLDKEILVYLTEEQMPFMFRYEGWWFVLFGIEVKQVTTEPALNFPTPPAVRAIYRMHSKA